MEADATDKKIRQGVSLSPRTNDLAIAKAKAGFGGNVSAYLRDLIERDASGSGVVPTAEDPQFLETLIASIFPTRRRAFARAWQAALAHVESRDNAATQNEVADSLLQSFLDLLESGRLDLDGVPAFCVVPGRQWDAIISAVQSGDIAAIRGAVAAADQSRTPLLVDDHPLALAAESDIPASERELAAARAEVLRRKAKPKTPRP